MCPRGTDSTSLETLKKKTTLSRMPYIVMSPSGLTWCLITQSEVFIYVRQSLWLGKIQEQKSPIKKWKPLKAEFFGYTLHSTLHPNFSTLVAHYFYNTQVEDIRLVSESIPLSVVPLFLHSLVHLV